MMNTLAMRGLNHNHTYLSSLDDAQNIDIVHPYSYKNKMRKMNNRTNENNSTRQQDSRDILLLQQNGIFMSLDEIVSTEADQFNELVKLNGLTSEQINIAKDVRRRGKNKIAAQICRKRKIDSIDSLKEQVIGLRGRKRELQSETISIEKQVN